MFAVSQHSESRALTQSFRNIQSHYFIFCILFSYHFVFTLTFLSVFKALYFFQQLIFNDLLISDISLCTDMPRRIRIWWRPCGRSSQGLAPTCSLGNQTLDVQWSWAEKRRKREKSINLFVKLFVVCFNVSISFKFVELSRNLYRENSSHLLLALNFFLSDTRKWNQIVLIIAFSRILERFLPSSAITMTEKPLKT